MHSFMNISDPFPIIRSFDLFKDVPDDQLQWLVKHAEIKFFKDGDALFRPGDPIEHTLLVLEGEFRLYAVSEKQERELASKSTGEVSGFLPFSRAKSTNGNGRIIGPTTLLQLHRSFEWEMLRDHYELCQVLVHEMTSRVREFTSFQKQTEKMAALGKLSAGLAHELNNPASAIVRSSLELKKHLGPQAVIHWLDDSVLKDPRNFILTGVDLLTSGSKKAWRLKRDPYLLETSIPGVFAAGDVRSGAMNRVASAVGEGAMAISFVHNYLAEI
jgi:CRP-like cAMP-binding protein